MLVSSTIAGGNCVPSLLAGILLGDESGIPEHVDQAFKDTGTSHIIVISGFNITVIAGLLATVSARLIGRGRVGARWGALIALVGIILYTILVGGDAAVVRAAIMGGLTLFAMQLGRRGAAGAGEHAARLHPAAGMGELPGSAAGWSGFRRYAGADR